MSRRGDGWYACRGCGAGLREDRDRLVCDDCGVDIPVVDGIPRFPIVGADPATASHFDHLAPIYESWLWFPPMYRLLVGHPWPPDDRALGLRGLAWDGDRVLDLACGTGRVTRWLAAAADAVDAIDVSMGMLRRVDGRNGWAEQPTVTPARMDAAALWFQDGTFGGITCWWALHLFDRQEVVLDEVYRTLAPGGWFAGTTLTDAGVLQLPGVADTARMTIGARTFERDELVSMLQAAGFERVRWEAHGAAGFFRAWRPPSAGRAGAPGRP